MSRVCFRCHVCGDAFTPTAPAEQHMDLHGGGRLESFVPEVADRVNRVLTRSAPTEQAISQRHAELDR